MLYWSGSDGSGGGAAPEAADPAGCPQFGQNRASSFICDPQFTQNAMCSSPLQPIDQARDVSRAEAIIDIDHRDVAGATVEHPEQRRQPVEASAVADAGRHRD